MPKESYKILIVDDSPVMQKMTTNIFQNDGYKVFSAWDGQECLQMTKSLQPDAVLMDVILPDADGKDIARQLMEEPGNKEMAIIFTTNTIRLEKDKGNEAFEINGYLCRAFAKPLHYGKVTSAVRKEINRCKNGGQLSPKVQSNQKGGKK